MNKSAKLFHPCLGCILAVVCILIGFFVGYEYQKNVTEKELALVETNLYGGRYYVELEYPGKENNPNSLVLSGVGFRFPTQYDDGTRKVKVSMPMIARTDAPYDIMYFALIRENLVEGFDFTFHDCPQPDDIFVQRWPREQQGRDGTFTNGELVAFEATDQPLKYHVSVLESGYIYSIYASWGPYYGEYAFLASANENDQVYWRLDDASK